MLFLGVLQYILLFVPKNFAALRAAFFVINIMHCYTVYCHCSAPQAKIFGLGLISFGFSLFLEHICHGFCTFSPDFAGGHSLSVQKTKSYVDLAGCTKSYVSACDIY